MKKLLSVILCIALLCSVGAAFAEANIASKAIIPFDENLSIGFAFPEGYNVNYTTESGIVTATAFSDEDTLPYIAVVIALDDEHEALPRLNDLSEEDKLDLVEALTEDMHSPECFILETGFGTEIIVIRENDTAQNYATLTTLYYGCIITMYMGRADGAVITDDEIAIGMQIYTDIDFIVAK